VFLGPVARGESYLDVIDRSRDERRDHAADSRGSPEPPRSRAGYRKKRSLDRELGRDYEQCKRETRGRFKSERRQKSYCAAVAWTRVKQSGKFADYPGFSKEKEPMRRTPKRDSKGRFLPKRSSESRRAKETRRAPRRAPARAASEARRAPRRPARSTVAAAPRRTTAGKRPRKGARRAPAQTNIAIVPVGVAKAPRSRPRKGSSRPRRASRAREMAYDAPVAGAAGLSLMFVGGMVGDLAADIADRWIGSASTANYNASASSLPAAYQTAGAPMQYNNDLTAMKPSMGRIGVQLLLAVLGIGGGAMVASPALKFLLYGFGFGAGFHLSTQLLTAYVIAPMFATAGATGRGVDMYQHEANTAQAMASTTPGSGYIGAAPRDAAPATPPPVGSQVITRRATMGAAPPPQLPSAAARVPVALANAAAAPMPATMGAAPTNGAAQPDCGCPPGDAPSTMGAPPSNGVDGGPHPMWSALLARAA